jgi:serine/threonine protein kinase
LRRLAVGGTAEISLARYDGIGGFEKLLALKRLLPSLCEDRAQVAQFLNEARISACLAHPNIAQTYEVGEVQGRYFIAMEYVHGVDLEKVLRHLVADGRRMPLEIALRIVSEICGGLHYAHGRSDAAGRPLQIVHRDVSPANMLISYDGGVKLIDFGVAKVLENSEMVRSGSFRGKFAYMSPEQCAGEPLDARSDIFSIGIVLYEASLGRRPFPGENQFKILREITEGAPIPPRTVDPEYPPELEDIVLRALTRRREERYPSALEMQADLGQFAAWRGYLASSVAVAEFLSNLFDTDSSSVPEDTSDIVVARSDMEEWTADETTTAQETTRPTHTSEDSIAIVYREGWDALQNGDYRRSIDTLRKVLARSPSHQLARQALDHAVKQALREGEPDEFRDELARAADLYDNGDLAQCRVVVENVIDDVPISSPARGVLRRISALISERLAAHGPEARGG